MHDSVDLLHSCLQVSHLLKQFGDSKDAVSSELAFEALNCVARMYLIAKNENVQKVKEMVFYIFDTVYKQEPLASRHLSVEAHTLLSGICK